MNIYEKTIETEDHIITLTIEQDYIPLEEWAAVKELDHNPFTYYGMNENPFEYTDFKFDNFYKTAYFKHAENWRTPVYYCLTSDIDDAKDYYHKKGFSRHDAWLKAMKQLKEQADYYTKHLDGTYTHASFILTIAPLDCPDVELGYDCMGSWDWSTCAYTGNNQENVRDYLANGLSEALEILPDGGLTHDQIEELTEDIY